MFQKRAGDEVSWHQPHLNMSLQMISQSGVRPDARILDVGAGDSTLAEDLVRKGYSRVTVLDISASALERARRRLGDAAAAVTWMEADILKANFGEAGFDLWHDRALFHFFTNEYERGEYVAKAKTALSSGGQLILATFAADGPDRCSGLTTMRYSPEMLALELGKEFTLVETRFETHRTPQGISQKFTYNRFRRL